jgi:hypothetical protein
MQNAVDTLETRTKQDQARHAKLGMLIHHIQSLLILRITKVTNAEISIVKRLTYGATLLTNSPNGNIVIQLALLQELLLNVLKHAQNVIHIPMIHAHQLLIQHHMLDLESVKQQLLIHLNSTMFQITECHQMHQTIPISVVSSLHPSTGALMVSQNCG